METGPAKGAETGSAKPAETGPAKPTETGPAKPAETGPAKGAETGPAKGAGTGPAPAKAPEAPAAGPGASSWQMPGVNPGQKLGLETRYMGMRIGGDAKVNSFDGKTLDMSLGVRVLGSPVKLDMKATRTPDGKLDLSVDKVDGARKSNQLRETYDIVAERPGELRFRNAAGKEGSISTDGRGGIKLVHPRATVSMRP